MKARVIKRLRSASSPLFMTGAGISAESGLPTFRGKDGLWRGASPEELATPQAFGRDPLRVWQWYDWRRGLISRVSPTAAHMAMAGFRTRAGREVPVITQNVDGLHQSAGSSHVLELHGSIWRLRCVRCGVEVQDRVTGLSEVPLCECGGLLRPAVVWFGELLPEDVFSEALELARGSDFVMVVGTSGVVQPAASLVNIAREGNAFIVEVNPEETCLGRLADISFHEAAGDIVAELLQV